MQVQVQSSVITAHRARLSDKKNLTYLPDATLARMKECCDKKTCIISIRSPDDPVVNEEVSSEVLATIHKSVREKMDAYHKAIISDALTWIVCSFPTTGWAKNVFPNLPSDEAVPKLWQVVKEVLRLNEPDPVRAWEQQQQTLLNRRAYLNKKQYKKLHLVAEETDLYIALHKRSVWLGGQHKSANNKLFQANVPTEEVYTSPDCRYTQGRVKARRPLTIFGKTVSGAEFIFENGKVVSAKAQENENALQEFLNAQDRNRYLGEIALVDIHSRVWKSNLMFNSILYDENAGVHFALGTAYTSGYGYRSTDTIPSPQELIDMGCNSSNFHTDFTIGYEKIDVYGVCENGTEEVIMQKGEFIPQEMQLKDEK